MKNIVNRALAAKKKQYIQPETMSQKMNFITRICVDSVHGNAGLQYGGQDNNIDPL